ncbi:MAG: acetamidase/formamidase family protein [Desulfurococcaceae archaeon]
MISMRTIVIPDKYVFYRFSPDNKPVAFIRPGDKVIIHTRDCFGGQITSDDQTIEGVDFSHVNPATGPLYIEGAGPGDALIVKILSIEIAEKGFIVTAPGSGVLHHLVKMAKTRPCYIEENMVKFLGYKIPVRKMIGVIGVATNERTPTGVPGRHGGNLDTRFITEGAMVVLPVEYEGALFGLGDLHATMGDGEVCVSACEVPGKVMVEFDIVKGHAPPWPIVQYHDSLYILVSHEDLNKALNEVVEITVEVISRGLNLEWHDAYMLASIGIDVGISQLVDPRKTVWARIPISLLTLDKLLTTLTVMKRSRSG